LLKDGYRRSFSDPQVVILGLFLVVGFAIVIGAWPKKVHAEPEPVT